MLPVASARKWRYLVAVISVLIALLVSILLQPLTQSYAIIVFLAAVAVNMGYGGLGSGLLTIALSTVIYILFLIPPLSALEIGSISATRVVLFIAVALVITVTYESRRRISESAFQQSQQFRATLTSIGDGVIATDAQGCITMLNPIAESLTGWTLAEAFGQPIENVFRIVNEETRQLVESPITRVLREGQVVGLANHTILIARDGRSIPIDDSGAPIRDSVGKMIGTVLVFRGIGERREAEIALREAEARFRSVANTAPVMIWMSGLDKKHTYFNQRWLDFAGETLDRELGFGWADRIHPDDKRGRFDMQVSVFDTRQPFETEYRLRRADGEYRWVNDRGVPRYNAAEEFVGYIGSVLDITERKHEEETQRFMTSVAALLASSLDYEATLQNVGRLAVPNFADWFAIDLVSADLKLEHSVVVHADPQKLKLADYMRAKWPPVPAAPENAAVLQQGRAQMFTEITDELLATTIQDGELLQIMRDLGLRSSIVVPIKGYKRILGMITLVSAESRRRYDDRDLGAAEELARWIALALENATSYHEAQQAAERVSRIQAVTEAFASSLTMTDASEIIVKRGLGDLGANAGVIALLDEPKKLLQVVSTTGYDTQRFLPAWQSFSVAEKAPMSDAVRTNQAIWVANEEQFRTLYPEMDVQLQGAKVVIPLNVSGQTIGVLWLNFAAKLDFEPDDRAFIMLLTEKCAQAIDRARLYEAERQFRAQAEASRDRLSFILKANTLLTSILDYELRLQNLAHFVIPYLADWCVIDLLERNEMIRRVAVAADPEKEGLFRVAEQAGGIVGTLDSRITISEVLRSGESKFYPKITQENLRTFAVNDDHMERLLKLELNSLMLVPLLARGRILGVISLGSTRPGVRYSVDELSLAEELARRAALTIDNARLYNEAQEQRARLQVTLSSIGDGVIAATTTGQITFMNAVAETLTGWKYKETSHVLLDDVFQIVNETTHAPEPSPIALIMQEDNIVKLADHTLLVAKHGAQIPIDDSGAPIRDDRGETFGIILAFRDITEQRNREIALKTALERAQDLYETCHEIGITNGPREIVKALLTSRYLTHASQSGILLFDSPWQETLPEHVESIGTPLDNAILPGFEPGEPLSRSPLASLLSRSAAIFIEDIQTEPRIAPDARNALIEQGVKSLVICPLEINHRCFGLLVLYFASPQQWTHEDYRHIQVFVDQLSVSIDNVRLLAAEAHARQEAEQANAIKLRFLATISHELRTPLTSIKGFATTLLATDVTWDAESQRSFIAIISEEADKLTDLIDQLLDLSRLQAGTLRIQTELCSLSTILGTAMAQLEALTEQHRMVMNVPLDLLPIRADIQRIGSVLVNLVGNAAKYAPPKTTITLTARTQGEFIQVEVADDGPGIESQNRVKVFEAFWQIERPAPKAKGVGLGLAICKGIITAHGGTIWIADTPIGTTVCFTLPIAR
jgi:PAS domain S-box-containing protein